MEEEKNELIRSEAVHYLGGRIREAADSIPPQILAMNEIELEEHFKPITADYLLRKNLWKLAEKAKNDNDTITISEWHKGICDAKMVYSIIAKNPYRLAWILMPIGQCDDLIEETFYVGIKRMRQILTEMPLTEKSAPSIIKAFEFFAVRHLGPVVQRIDQRTMSVNVDGNKAIREVVDQQDIMQKYDELKSRLTALPIEASKVEDPE
jgi:hypothetical protein